ncbi:calpain-6-like [Panonychus citri]|uniref:calpain-6-like n=1 Tax=Panonychus citri TaxID=50023 RepID=UPI00230756BC|nr:calpain-6-like [Panonychus citri]
MVTSSQGPKRTLSKEKYSKVVKECQETGVSYVDTCFRAEDSSVYKSIGFKNKLIAGKISWKRPKEITSEPYALFKDKIGPNMNIQFFGFGPNEWLIAAAVALSQDKNLIYKILPKDQYNFNHGIFKIWIWDYGTWTKVLIDDKLPVSDNRLIFTSSQCGQIFWLSLLEKAYAKLKGNYETMSTFGNLTDALTDFSGSPTEQIKINLDDDEKELFRLIAEEINRKSIVCLKTREDCTDSYSNGLKQNHFYVVTSVKKPASGTFKKNSKDGIASLKIIDTIYPEKRNCRSSFLDEKYHEQWINLEKFSTNFESITICRLHIEDNRFVETRHSNMSSQFCFDVTNESEEIMIDLIQKNDQPERFGFKIYQVELNRRYRLHNPSLCNMIHFHDTIKTRSIFHRIKLAHGRYIIKPVSKSDCDLMIRLYSKERSNLRVLDEDMPKKNFFRFLAPKYPKFVTKITVQSITGIEKQDRFGSANPYLIIRCGGDTVKSTSINNTLDPDFKDFSAIFYHGASDTIMIEVWNNSLIFDSFIGQVEVTTDLSKSESSTLEEELCGRKKGHKRPGIVKYKVHTSEDLKSL